MSRLFVTQKRGCLRLLAHVGEESGQIGSPMARRSPASDIRCRYAPKPQGQVAKGRWAPPQTTPFPSQLPGKPGVSSVRACKRVVTRRLATPHDPGCPRPPSSSSGFSFTIRICGLARLEAEAVVEPEVAPGATRNLSSVGVASHSIVEE